jgi:hypothetical protein
MHVLDRDRELVHAHATERIRFKAQARDIDILKL